ncbi:MAG: BamA/TamA family outer membrane protein, partial [Proteobacteria bacterium]|nr:BamA/TamA family outer membrane protein [Pseudomonadota bacterium]
GVRVTDDFDAATKTSFDRRTKRVTFTVTIDPRRLLSVVFEGHDPNTVPDDQLLEQLTFNVAGSSDDVEAQESAKAIVTSFQTRGFFDARVTWSRERFPEFDRIVFRIDQGGQRKVRDVQFVGNHAVTTDALEDAVATKQLKLSNQLLGTTVRATSNQMIADVGRVTALYYGLGYRDVHVRVNAGTDPAGLDSAALSAALLSADRGAGGLYVRFTIDEGEPTLLTQLRVEFGSAGDAVTTPDQRALCDRALDDLAEALGERRFATAVTSGRCIDIAPNVKYRPAIVERVKDTLRDQLWNLGRPRARVEHTARQLGPHRFEAIYKLSSTEPLKMGRVVIRGNFKTRDSIILRELHLVEGAPLTANSLAEAARRLRSTGLFDAVNLDMPDLERTNGGEVNAIVRVEERYDYLGAVDFEVGGSSYSGVFAKVSPQFKNLFGVGVSLDLSGTIGFDFFELYTNSNLKLRQLNGEATLKFPGFLGRRFLRALSGDRIDLDVQTELTAFTRLQDTARFGPVKTQGTTLALSKTWQGGRTEHHAAWARTIGGHYDFRLRERQVDVLRPIGADDDQTQVPISTRTGSVGLSFEWEQRTDRNGSLSPLAPEAGFRLDAAASFASPNLLGQDTFFKVSASGSKYTALTDNLVLRSDLRYDQGFPLGGAVLLPEVERFFAGGDATVRGYADERLATEILQVGVPPLANVEQIRVLSAGGNIRVMASLDAQLRIYKVLSSALFVDAGLITNKWETVETSDIRPSVGMALLRIVTPFGSFAFERAIPLHPHLGDDPRGRWHISFAARAQF